MSDVTFIVNLDKEEYLSSDKFAYPNSTTPDTQWHGMGSMSSALDILMEGLDRHGTSEYFRMKTRRPTYTEEKKLPDIKFITTEDGSHYEMPAYAGRWAGDRIVKINRYIAPRTHMSKALQLEMMARELLDAGVRDNNCCALYNSVWFTEPSERPKVRSRSIRAAVQTQYTTATWELMQSTVTSLSLFHCVRKHWYDISHRMHDQMTEFQASRSTVPFYKQWLRQRLGYVLADCYAVASERNVSGLLGQAFDLFWLGPQSLANFLKQYTEEVEIKNVKTWLRKQILTPQQREIINKYGRVTPGRFDALVDDLAETRMRTGPERIMPTKQYLDAALLLSSQPASDHVSAGCATLNLLRATTGNNTNQRVIHIDNKERADAESTPDTVDPE